MDGMDDLTFIREVGAHLGLEDRRALDVIYAVFRELRDRLTPREAADLAAQLPSALRHLWQEQERPDRPVERTHATEFVGRVRYWAGLQDDGEAGLAVRTVFRELQRLLGSPTGKEGEAWDVYSQLPKDLKKLWLAAAEPVTKPT
jgi:uncharacterized protein (DUF2267 family)